VKATRVDDLCPDGRWAAPGSFRFYKHAGVEYLHFMCPCGCEGVYGVSFAPARWTLHGTRHAPTVKPSIRAFDPSGDGAETHWHGYLTAGEWRNA
jgi:hypothetical protein